jgi:starch phosphorylase
MDFDSALELVAANTVFTTHTPVSAGHDVLDFSVVLAYFRDLMAKLGISESHFLGLGANPRNPHGFNMTALALRGSRFHNGVSRIHGGIASQMEAYIWPQVPPEENPIGYTTNGTDVDTFLGHSWVALFDMYMGGGWRSKQADRDFWQDFIDGIPSHVYISTRQVLKAEMLDDARHRARIQYRRAGYPESVVSHITRLLTPRNLDTLVIGFARRFATYKRAALLFQDLDRLARLVNSPERPVLFIFAGKAHPEDQPGQQLLKDIFRISMRPEFQGRIIVVEDYNLSMARKLLPGVDVWLNTPEYPKEACGTSGMKAAINGAINVSVLDGWWAEAYDGENGWAIIPHPELDPHARIQEESVQLLNILEYEVVPLYFAGDVGGEPEAWVRKSKTSMKSVLPRFNSVRMASDYLRAYYGPAKIQGRLLKQDQASGATTLARWKKKVAETWSGVRIRVAAPAPRAINVGDRLPMTVAVYLNGLSSEDVVVECVLGKETELLDFVPIDNVHFTPVDSDGQGETRFYANLRSPKASPLTGGLQPYKVRVYPYHPLLTHRFECGYMLWL